MLRDLGIKPSFGRGAFHLEWRKSPVTIACRSERADMAVVLFHPNGVGSVTIIIK